MIYQVLATAVITTEQKTNAMCLVENWNMSTREVILLFGQICKLLRINKCCDV